MNKENEIKIENIHKRARYLRGRFLNSLAVIERNIALILTDYFCTDDGKKRELFFTKVAERLSLQKKKNILIDIVKKDYPEYWEKNKQFLLEIQKIQELRNKLAHSVIDISKEAIERPLNEGIGFIQWKEGSPITDNEFEEWEVKVNMLSSTLIDIKRLLPFKEV